MINPGSTSTKLSLHEDEKMVFSTDVFHDSSELLKYPTINDQLDLRMDVIYDFLAEKKIDLQGIDAVVGRGGGCYSVEGGTYIIDDLLVEDTKNAKGGLYHASMLGVQMAARISEKYGCPGYMVDPPVVDELQDAARISGVKGVYRRAICHALNLKATARMHCRKNSLSYENARLIVCHIDGGISVTAHRNGRMIDGNDAGGGEGPFPPTRMGTMAVTDVLNYLFDEPAEQVRRLCSQAGGLSSHFGTSNSDVIHGRIEQGDKEAARVWHAMLYQTAKTIGSMAAVLEGRVDGIVLTGGLLRFPDVRETIETMCGWIAPVSCYPGEIEHIAMAEGALRVLRNEETPRKYSGRPVWSGFTEEG